MFLLQIRRWLERVRLLKREPPRWQRPPGLTDERRVELMGKVNEWREDHTVRIYGNKLFVNLIKLTSGKIDMIKVAVHRHSLLHAYNRQARDREYYGGKIRGS